MPGFRKIKLSDALRPSAPVTRGGHHGLSHVVSAEQVREAQESTQAHEAGASIRDRMVAIGRGNQQAGRQK
jgi:hypothetical protein